MEENQIFEKYQSVRRKRDPYFADFMDTVFFYMSDDEKASLPSDADEYVEHFVAYALADLDRFGRLLARTICKAFQIEDGKPHNSYLLYYPSELKDEDIAEEACLYLNPDGHLVAVNNPKQPTLIFADKKTDTGVEFELEEVIWTMYDDYKVLTGPDQGQIFSKEQKPLTAVPHYIPDVFPEDNVQTVIGFAQEVPPSVGGGGSEPPNSPKEIIQRYLESFIKKEEEQHDDQEYQETFADEGERKSKYIIEYLERVCAPEELKDFGYISIGGADGSELEYILSNTPINHGVLLEYSDAASNIARKKAEKLKSKDSNLKLDVMQGDALARLSDATEALKKSGKKGVILSAQAILHELPSRSPLFEKLKFSGILGLVYKGFDHGVFVCREPCEPFGWPKDIRLKIPGVEADMLTNLCELIRDKLGMKSNITALAGDWVMMDSVLAVESLHKAIRQNPPKRFQYELGEQLTSFEPTKVGSELRHYLDCTPHVERVTTGGFRKSYIDFSVQAIAAETDEILPLPVTHVVMLASGRVK